MTKRWNLDEYTPPREVGVIQRREENKYGSLYAAKAGLVPVEAYPDVLVDPADYKEVIQHCHDAKIFPMYHQAATWAPDGFSYDQNGIGYCWTWSGTACLMDCRALEDKETVLLAPVSMGYLVGWRNEGNYLEDFIGGARNHGIAPADCVGGINSANRNPNSYCDDWETQAKQYRLAQVWDCSPSKMTQHCLSILAYGRPIFIAFDWWGHALELIGLRYDGNTLVWIIRNSHGETEPIELTGSRAIPDEAYGFISTILA